MIPLEMIWIGKYGSLSSGCDTWPALPQLRVTIFTNFADMGRNSVAPLPDAADDTFVGRMSEDVGNRSGPVWVAKRWRNFGQGREHEIALQHAWMRDLQVRRVNGVSGVKQNIEIDEARAFGEGLLAAHVRFDLAKRGEELRGGQFGLRFDDGVQKPGLVEVIDRLRFVNAGKL